MSMSGLFQKTRILEIRILEIRILETKKSPVSHGVFRVDRAFEKNA